MSSRTAAVANDTSLVDVIAERAHAAGARGAAIAVALMATFLVASFLLPGIAAAARVLLGDRL